MPDMKEGQVLIKVDYAGVCGSDIHAFIGDHPSVKPPIVLGHELSGTVEKAADDRFLPGAHVTIEPSVACGQCYNCKHGKYHICADLRVIGCDTYSGGFADYIAVPTDRVVRLPGAWESKRGVMVEPAAVAVHAVHKGNLRRDDAVLILGSGAIGILTMQAAKAMGAGDVIMIDPLESRLAKAIELGAAHGLKPGVDLKAFLVTHYPDGFDLIFDGVANEKTLDQAIFIARKGTRIVLLGVPSGKLLIDLASVQDFELELMGTLMYQRADYNAAIELIDAGLIKVDGLITNVYPLAEVQGALEEAVSKSTDPIKILIDCR